MAALASADGGEDPRLLRTLDKTVALTGSKIQVTATLTNTGTNALRGFYFYDQIPSSLEVTTLDVNLNGQTLTNYSVEVGKDGDVYPECTPWRWTLETPAVFPETNPIPPQATVQIVFSISCSSTGRFDLQQFGWTAVESGTTNRTFGFSDWTDHQTVTFVEPPRFRLLSLQLANNAAVISWESESGKVYRLLSQDLGASNEWQQAAPDARAIGPVTTLSVPLSSQRGRLYRVLKLP